MPVASEPAVSEELFGGVRVGILVYFPKARVLRGLLSNKCPEWLVDWYAGWCDEKTSLIIEGDLWYPWPFAPPELPAPIGRVRWYQRIHFVASSKGP